MNIAIDISPLKAGNFLQHRVRGTGFYLENLNKSLKKYFPNNNYYLFSRGEKVPRGVDVIHYPYFEPFFLALPFSSKNKFVVTVHDLTPLVFPANFPPGIKGKIKWMLQKNRLRRASAVITDSESSKKDIVRFTGIKESKVDVVYLASAEDFSPNKRNVDKVKKKYNLPDKFVLYVGDITWNKNLPSLLRAVMIKKIPLVMVGKALVDKDFDRANPWNQDMAKVSELVRDNGNIFALGFVDHEDLVALYSSAVAFVMPSFYEGFGLPILEAMSCGCPVITSRGGSIPEIAQDAAFYIDPYDIDDISEGIEKVFNDKSLQEDLSRKGILQAEKFSWKKTAENTIKVYDKVASEK